MGESERVVIAGAGLGGAAAAGALRASGFTGEIILFGAERHQPYELPPLSKALLLGETDEPDWVHESTFYAEQGIDLHTSTLISQLRPADHLVVDDTGGQWRYDRLVLATGSRPRTLPMLDGDSTDVLTLRTWDDSLALRQRLTAGTRVVIIGGGWIGCEVAAAARHHDADVTVIEPLAWPLVRVLGDTIGRVFRDLHADHGVTWRLGVGVSGLDTGADGGRLVRLSDGGTVPADVVILAVGAAPNVDLAGEAGLELVAAPVGGIAVDATLRTSAPDVYAVGDVAAHAHPRYHQVVRVEHWANAKDQGVHVAANVLGATLPYQSSPFFFSDQYDLGLEYRGFAAPERDELVVRGELDTREFIAFWLRDGRVRAAMNVNSWDDGDALQALVDSQATVDASLLTHARLADLVA